MNESTHKAVVREIEGLGFFGLCLYCGDRGEIEEEAGDASDWATAHILRAREGNMLPFGNKQIQKATAVRTYRLRSKDPRWSEKEQEMWAMMASELEQEPDNNEGQGTLF